MSKLNQSAFDLAAKQRYIALKNSFNTIRQFAEPTLDPETFKQFELLEKRLLKVYKKGVTIDLVKKILEGRHVKRKRKK